MSFAEWVLWLGTSAALGVISSVILTVIKKAFPAVQDKVAVIASVLLAAVVSAVAVLAAPYLDQLPPAVETFWPMIVWVAGQVWYEVTKPAA